MSAPEPLVMISDELAKFFGSGEREMLQSDALKRLWEYIDTNQLKVFSYTLTYSFFVSA